MEGKYPAACVSQFTALTSTARIQLNPYESTALTRLVMAFCLGKGSLCLYSRSVVLQVGQPSRCGDYSRYQWRRLCQFLPQAKPPVLFMSKHHQPEVAERKGQWRLRVCSRWFETAYNMLYPVDGMDETGFRPFRVDETALSLLGAEAMASLWADRGRLLTGSRRLQGQLNLSQLSFSEAEVIQGWIARLTGAHGVVDHSPRRYGAPVLKLEGEDAAAMLQALKPTWHAQASCLASKFNYDSALLNAPSRSGRVASPRVAPKRRRSGRASAMKPRPEIPVLLQRQVLDG